MHIVHVIDNMHLDRGGPVAVVMGLSGAQVSAGDRVTIVCRAQRRPGEPHSPAHRLTAGVQLIETDRASSQSAKSVVSQLAPDVIHLHGVWERNLRQFAATAQAFRVPWVLSTHGMLHPVPLSKGWLKKRLYLSLLGVAVTGARRLLVTSAVERDHAEKLFGARAEVVFNGIDLTEFGRVPSLSSTALRASVGRAPYLLFLGRIHPIKGIDGLVRSYAIARSRGLRADLVLAGPPDGHEGTVAALARELGVSDSVHFVGPLYGPPKLDALAGCALFVHRPRYEGFGMTVVEAMAAGRPVLTTAACGVARECPCGVLDCCEDSDEAFAAAMVRRCSADAAAETEALAARGRDWVRRELSWDAIARRVRELYR